MKWIFFILLTMIGFQSTAQKESSLLWEISGNGLQQPSYLFGTIHMICEDDFIMTDVVKEKFKSSSQIFLELDMDDPGMQIKMMKLAMLPQGETLKKLFGPDYPMVDSFFQKNTQFSLALFNQFKPLMVMSMLYLKMLPCENTASYETRFVSMAKEQQKDVQGLETIEDQMQVFDNIPDSLEAINIVKMVKEFKQQQEQFDEMIKVYKQQNIDQLFDYVNSSPDLMESQEDLLTKRNANWIPIMEKNMKQSGCFFAVGAAHLGGEIGVIALLKKKGYTVKAVKL